MCCCYVPCAANPCYGGSVPATAPSTNACNIWRAGTGGTVDPWTKNEINIENANGLIQAGVSPCCAIKQACTDTTKTLKTVIGGSACPADAVTSASSLFGKIFSNLEYSIIFIVIAAIILLIVFNRITAPR
jgi:hypothetical protein